ncbi:putative FBD domain, leucine-rich repeat domain, L domain-containing protein [Medicago truncatula]|nr:putative FBD domain, leucine-rich repeat domain, L domain-containing protein [Medicago truncatula]
MLSRVTNQPLKIFSLNCRFMERKQNSSFNLKKWLEATKRHCIEEFHLNLHFHHTLKPVVFISQTFVVLKLQRLDIEKDTSCVDLPSLKTLNLEYVSFENWNDYINFLYGCPILEDLQVEDISIRTLTKHYENNVPDVGFKSLTLAKLVRASIDSKDAHFNGIDNVEFLRIIKGYGSKEECFEFIPVFSNLVHIELVFWYHSIHSWDGVVELLRHSPRLQILFIKKWRKTRSSKEWKCPISNLECVSSHLRSCTILNFDNSANDLRFAKYILQNARILQDMKIGFVIKSLNEILLEKGQIKEELSSFSRISRGCKLSFEFKFIY